MGDEAKLMQQVQEALQDSDRYAKYRGNPNPMAGHCYVATEALYHLLGGHTSPWSPMWVRHEGEPHWYLQHTETGKRLDPTASQFKSPPPYKRKMPDGRWDRDNGPIPKGFLTKEPSKRTVDVLQRISMAASTPPALRKAIDPEHMQDVTDKVDPFGDGEKTVNHKLHLIHPAANHPEMKLYDEEMLHSPETFEPIDNHGYHGVFQKSVFEHPSGQRFLLKAYHDDLSYLQDGGGSGRAPSQAIPVSHGWSEMASQGMYHAMEIGHLHQKVATKEHPLLEGDIAPFICIAMAHSAKTVSDEYGSGFPNLDQMRVEGPSLLRDSHKIALMDYLSGNGDRHAGNLMVNRPQGLPAHLLAVDNSFSYQYHRPPERDHDSFDAPSQSHDRFGNASLEDSWRKDGHKTLHDHMGKVGVHFMDIDHLLDTAKWWVDNKAKAHAEFANHHRMLKTPEAANIMTQFKSRANELDNWARKTLAERKA